MLVVLAVKNIMKKILFLFVIAVLSVGYAAQPIYAGEEIFTKEEKECINSLGVLKVGYVQDRIPISFTDEKTGELGGVSRMIFDRIQEISGLKFQYQALPQGSVTYDYLSKEAYDLVTSVEYNEQNLKANGILVSQPYLSSKKVIIGHEGVTLESNQKLKIAVATGSQTLKKVLHEQYPNFEIIDYDTIEDCFEAVNNEGNADFLIQNQYVAEYRMYRPQYENLKVLPAVGLDDRLCFSAVIPVKNAEKSFLQERQELIRILNKSIAQISEDDIANYIVRADMENQYHDSIPDFLYRYRYTVIFLFSVLVIVCVLIFILIRLRIRTLKARADAETKAQFLSMMSHEIRTPLNGLLGLNHLIAYHIENKEKVRDYLQQSSEVTKYLLTLVNDILNTSKLQKKQITLENREFSIEDMLAMVNSVTESRMKEKKITYSVQKDIQYSGLIGDEVRIEQVLLSILDNAYKFTPKGGRVSVEVFQRKHIDGKICTHITVTDTGQGMSEEFQKKIFDSFTRESDTVSKGNQGTGLGMAISHELARMMGGNLTVKSKVGKGSSFTFTFVTEHAKKQEKTEAVFAQQADEDANRERHILVAEDNNLNAEILLDLLKEGGFAVTLAVNGKEAVDKFAASKEGTYDYILMDILMPVKNGLEATREIRRLPRADAATVKIIACTANAFEEDKQKALDSGMDDFIAKPIDMENLMKKLQK